MSGLGVNERLIPTNMKLPAGSLTNALQCCSQPGQEEHSPCPVPRGCRQAHQALTPHVSTPRLLLWAEDTTGLRKGHWERGSVARTTGSLEWAVKISFKRGSRKWDSAWTKAPNLRVYTVVPSDFLQNIDSKRIIKNFKIGGLMYFTAHAHEDRPAPDT